IYEKTKYDFRLNIEPAFRKMLQGKLSGEFGINNKNGKLDAIKTDKKWQWLGKLYPTVFTEDYQIYIMSMDKFMMKNSPIVDPSYTFINSELLDNAVIFIDEFDSAKKTMLDNIIKNNLNGKIDFIEMFKSIYSSMNTNVLPTIYITPSNQRKNSSKTLRQIVDDTRKKAEEIYNKYAIYFNYRTLDNTENSEKKFMFQDYQFHYIVDGNEKYICIETNKKKKLNNIKFSAEKPDRSHNINSLISEVRGFISWFQGTVHILAINYKQLKDKQYKHKEEMEFPLEQAVRSVISEFQLDSNYEKYLVSQILFNSYRQKNNWFADSLFDRSVYEKGFRYYCFEDDVSHDMQTKIMMQSFNNTPEKMLLCFCEKSKVIGMSATATIPTVIGNFDLEYLQNKMGNRYCTVSDEDFSRLKNDFQKSQSGYDKIKIHSELIGASGYSVRTWESIVSDKEIAEKIYDDLDIHINEQGSYFKERYARIAIAFRRFLEHDDIRSFLCFLTAYPVDNNDKLDKKMLENIFVYISKDLPDVIYDIEILTGENYDKQKADIIKRLADGEKLFVISTYKTIGAGQNLQYPVPEDLKDKLIHSNNRNSRNEKDFDAVYLERPTHLIVNITDDLTEENFAEYMFQMEFLQERYELSMTDTRNKIKKAFRSYFTGLNYSGGNYDPVNIYELESVKLYATAIIIQAIGRICRTNMKNKNIYIFADDRLVNIINPDVTKGRIFNFEFVSLCDKIRKLKKSYSKPDNFMIKADTISKRASLHIDSMLNNVWTDKTMYFWKTLRHFVLKYPTMSGQEEEPYMIRSNYFIQLPVADNKLYYSQSNDFHKISVSFTPKQNYSIADESKTRLNLFMKWEAFREYFIKKGYTTEFKSNEYIMSPAVWNNIYKGALGEEIGKFWFSEILEINLEELNNSEIFELFDFKIPDKQIFVDFKNWYENYDTELQSTLDKIFTKIKTCNCKLAIIANVLATEKHIIRLYEKNGVKVLVVPSLLQYNNDEITIDESAVNQIWRCLNEYTN
ncbi:MAG: hypothetical protein K2J32_09180, partial [Ruminococcus sp.]|nr:hypothetical protein [Ruminococcus sp.]